MPLVTFVCPECQKVLKNASPVPAGKKIKCPTCGTVFPAPERQEEESDAVSDRPRRAATARADDDEDEPRPRRKAAARADDDEGAGAAPRKGGGKKKSSGGITTGAMIGLGVLLLLVLGGAGVGAYFLLYAGVNRGTGNEAPLAYVPPGAEFVAGADGAALLNDPDLGPQAEKNLVAQARAGNFFEQCKKETGLETKELFAEVRLAGKLDGAPGAGGMPPGGMPGMPGMPGGAGGMAPPGGAGGGMAPRGGAQGQGGMAPPGGARGGAPGGGMPGGGMPPMSPMPGAMPGGSPVTVILKTSRAFDQKKVAKAASNANRKSSHGKVYYEINDGGMRTLFMPSDRLIVLSSLPADQLEPLFLSEGTAPSVPPATLGLIRSVEKNLVWLAVPFDEAMHARIAAAAKEGPKKDEKPDAKKGDKAEPKKDPMKPLTDVLAGAQGVAAWGALDGEQVTFGVKVACADDAAATKTAATAQDAWKAQKAELDGLVLVGILFIPKSVKAYNELTKSLTFSADGTMAQASAHVGRKTLAEAAGELDGLQKGGGLFGGGGANRGGGKK